MDRAEVRVLEQVDKEGLGGLLEGLDRLTLPPQAHGRRVGEDVAADLADES